MKKVLVLSIMIILIVASTSFAAYETGTKTLGSTDTTTFTTSNNVYIDYTAGTNGVSYVAGSYHQTGTRTFGTSSGDTRIYWRDGTGQTLPSAPTTSSGTANWTGWNAL